MRSRYFEEYIFASLLQLQLINNQQYGVPLMQIAKAVQRIQRAEAVSKFKDETAKKLHFEQYAKATGTEKLKLFHVAIAEGWV